MSVITRIELLSKPLVEVVLQRVMATISTMDVLPLDEPAILETIRLRQLHKKKLPDAIIAATALVHGLTIVTRNVADFANIAGLRVLNPHDPTTLPPL